MPVIGFLNGASPDGYAPSVAAFRQGLNEGRDGQNATIKYRWAENHYNRLPALAADLVRQKVTVIAATTTPAVLAAKAATSTAPIVFRPGFRPRRAIKIYCGLSNHRATPESGGRDPPHCLEAVHSPLRAAQVGSDSDALQPQRYEDM